MDKYSDVIKSFEIQKELNPKFWVESGNEVKLKSTIREKLLETAYQFIDTLGVDLVVDDIIMIGSLANYNWSKFSDIDLHIVANFNQFPSNQIDLYTEYFDLKKIVFNQKHNITIYGYEVECYVQDESTEAFSSGVYSILFDMWMNEPKKEEFKVDKTLLKQKSQQWMDIIDGVLENIEDEDPESVKELISKYKKKLKKYRQCGLESGGESSLENMVFKVLRRNGYIGKLYDFGTEVLDKKLSIK
jgi:predicted nucleotidyltransferase